MTTDAVAQQLKVEPAKGLSSSEAQQRLQQYGPNKLAAKKKEPGWQAFLRQYRDFMQIILVAAAIINFVFTQDLSTTLVLLILTVFNAVLGLRQEAKAEASLAALASTMKNITRVRRDGEAKEVEAENLVPGDIVLMEAGNVVPADGRLFVTATMEIEEAALTGESVATLKDTAAIDKPEVALGDRVNMAFHEHVGDPRPRRDDRHHDRHGHRDGPHRRPAQQDRGRQDAAAEAARQADDGHCRHRGHCLHPHDHPRASATASPLMRSSFPVWRWRFPPSRPACRQW